MSTHHEAGQTTQPEWLGQEERGSMRALYLAVGLARLLGRRIARSVLPLACLYFLVFASTARRASRQYLARALGRPASAGDVYRHFHAFASCVLDRVYFLSGHFDDFEITIVGETALLDAIEAGSGCILLGAHLGSFEVLRTLGREHTSLGVKMLMFERNARKISAVLNAINPDLANDVISLGRPDSFITVQRCLADGNVVGLLADRSLHRDRLRPQTFLGAHAQFPSSPFRLLPLLQVPVVLMFGLYRGGNRYEVHFETFTPPARDATQSRAAALDGAMCTYVERLEHHCRLAPYNWFNFYDFWQ